jgi:hypothetical protein
MQPDCHVLVQLTFEQQACETNSLADDNSGQEFSVI